MQKLMTAIAALIVAVLTVPTAAGAAKPRLETYRDTFTTTTPNASAGRHFQVEFVNPDDPEAKPPAVQHVALRLHPGSRFDTATIERCGASDPELMALGADACPAKSRVGTNLVVVDTGFPEPGRFATTDFVFFNAKDQLILLGTVRGTGARVVIRGRLRGNALDIDVPPLPGTPPDGGADKRERAVFLAASSTRDGRRRNYLTTPPTCPASGRWTHRVTYTYRDGVTQTGTAFSPCTNRASATAPGSLARPRVSVARMPEGCAARDFIARFRVRSRPRLRWVHVALDGRRIASTSGRRFRRRIRAGALRAGRHRIAVSARSDGGRARRVFEFRRCGRAGPARFPG